MKTKQLLCAIVMMLCASYTWAQNQESVWHIATDQHVYVPMDQVEYLLFVDDSNLFSIVKTNGEIISEVDHVYFRNVPLAVEEVKQSFDISIFPNPVSSNLCLKGLNEDASVQVMTLAGALVIDTVVSPANANVDIAALPAGVYMLRVNETVIKFIKK